MKKTVHLFSVHIAANEAVVIVHLEGALIAVQLYLLLENMNAKGDSTTS